MKTATKKAVTTGTPTTALEIYLTKSRKIMVQRIGKPHPPSTAAVATFNRNLMSLGFVCSQKLTDSLTVLDRDELGFLYDLVVPILKKMVGAHKAFRPMYPNFPKQVMEASEEELFWNAITHYWVAAVRDASEGQPRLFGGRLMDGVQEKETQSLTVPLQWLPEYEIEKRSLLPNEEVSLKVINLGSHEDFCGIFTRLIGSNGSLSESDKEIVKWFVENQRESIPGMLPQAIPQKENLTFLIGSVLKYEVPTYLIPYIKTATDVLRVATAMSDGDVSLATPGKFRSFKRTERRFILEALESISDITEDMLRYNEMWKRLGRQLRPGDYADRYPNTFRAFGIVRNDDIFNNFNSKVEKAIRQEDAEIVVDLLKTRPGDFARRLDHLLRTFHDRASVKTVLSGFTEAAADVSTPVLLQVYAHFKNRKNQPTGGRAFFPKGNVAKVQFVEESLPPLPPITFKLESPAEIVTSIVRNALVERFGKLPSLGRVYLDTALGTQNVPFAQRSASKTLRTISRGSQLALPICDTLRFFVWWKDGVGRTDIDLATVFYDSDWNNLGLVSYYNLRDWGCAHSGDITSAPNGAAEFIDAHLPSLRKKNVRYVSMLIYSFTQQAFKDLPECFAGWMARQKVQSGEIFEGRTVRDKIDIAGDTTVNIPLIIDLQEEQVVWADIALKNRNAINNSNSNRSSLAQMGKAITTLVKPTLYDLFDMHTEARAKKRVSDPSKADTVFSLHEGITPFDADKIMSEFMAN